VQDEETLEPTYATQVGARLRAVRKARRMSLQAVEVGSNQEFKASVLGAYERGERAISVPRLQRLARFYKVTVDALLPQDAEGGGASIDLRTEVPIGDPPAGDGRVTIDLRRLGELGQTERELLGRYLGMIQLQRHGTSGYLITIRHEDLRAISCLLETTADGARHRLEELAVRERV
jgi:transcriptional regulator with XRE-family HTH domain